METDITFYEGDCKTSITLWESPEKGMVYLRLLDGCGEEEDFTQCHLTIDQLEYVGKRILDAVEYMRNQISL